MLIINQRKDEMLNMDKIQRFVLTMEDDMDERNKEYEIYVALDNREEDNYTLIGKYENKQRAFEVLKEIGRAYEISHFMAISPHEIYQMPEK